MKTTISYNGVDIHVFPLGYGDYYFEAAGQDFETMEDAKGYIDDMASLSAQEDLEDANAEP